MNELFTNEILKENTKIIQDYHDNLVNKVLELEQKKHQDELDKLNEEQRQ